MNRGRDDDVQLARSDCASAGKRELVDENDRMSCTNGRRRRAQVAGGDE